MKLPRSLNPKSPIDLTAGDRAFFVGSKETIEVTIIDRDNNGGRSISYLIVVDDEPQWYEKSYFWGLEQIAAIEKLASIY